MKFNKLRIELPICGSIAVSLPMNFKVGVKGSARPAAKGEDSGP